MKHINTFEEHLNESSNSENAYDQHEELVDIILKYVKDPDEAEKYASMDSEQWPSSLSAQLDRDDEYQEFISQ
jgi:hypothetical protein